MKTEPALLISGLAGVLATVAVSYGLNLSKDQIVAVLRGPMVLAADLGAADNAYSAPAPALVGEHLLSQFQRLPEHRLRYQTLGIGKPKDMQYGSP